MTPSIALAIDTRQPSVEHPKEISSLPLELVRIVFSLTRTPASEDRKLPSVHTLTRVSQFWRTAAQEFCPELWSELRIFHFRTGQVEMVDEYLRRSNTLPLDISIDVPEDEQPDTFLPIALRIWSVPGRWRTLRISTTAHNFIAIDSNVDLKGAPLLDTLDLSVSDIKLTSDKASFRLAAVPALKSLTLHGITLVGPSFAWQIEVAWQVETLDISCTHAPNLLHRFADPSSLDYAREVTPHLRHLTYHASVPGVSGRFLGPFTQYLSSLTTLTLRKVGDYADTQEGLPLLCGLVATPALEELSLDIAYGRAYRIFTDALSDAQLKFPALRVLRLTSVAHCAFHAALPAAFPALEQLRLRDVDPCSFVRALLSDPDAVLWPHLHTLALESTDYVALRAIAEARIAAGCRLAVLEVDSSPEVVAIAGSALQWLQTNVQGFKHGSCA
ncbi:hypothetical protein DFH07DRAFT_506296 [Mycena maculata]|uniref:F-box domain-containing protein n=1 Tax=Mycena maculata TaxID=230809 RepID=A0AAD7J427_9AGAR|nr:hypothetical protein DFH07DRAFT_506296 [Mycena maculata]